MFWAFVKFYKHVARRRHLLKKFGSYCERLKWSYAQFVFGLLNFDLTGIFDVTEVGVKYLIFINRVRTAR